MADIQLVKSVKIKPVLDLNAGSDESLSLGTQGQLCRPVSVLDISLSKCPPIPIIDEIYGGSLGEGDEQFAPINGLLNGGSL